ncbi:MAG: glucose-1-phosphate thymidylyltransferase [Thermodesulfobacteriota bacterium]|nr:MAG: glucose-1-phosphate thymidylyltransferase [Thermodesulfobacteriota bacterium]
MPVYDKPMIYYPLSVLMLAGIREILIITTPNDQGAFKTLLGDGSQWGIELSYTVQANPDGLAQAFILGEKFIGNDAVSLVLGDNIFFGQGLAKLLQGAVERVKGATIFAYYVKDPERYGVVTFDKDNKVVGLEEKPKKPESNFAVTGLYFYDNNVIDIAKQIKPSSRGELEITDVNKIYMERSELRAEVLGRGFAWLDTGTHASLLSASNFIQVVEERQNLKIACPEEIAYRMAYIGEEELLTLANTYNNSDYGLYLLEVLKSGHTK